MNRRDFVTKLALGVAVTPAAVKAATELAPVDSSYLCDMSYGTPDMNTLLDMVYSMKTVRDSEPPRDYIDVIVPDRETGLRLQRMFGSARKVATCTDEVYEARVIDILNAGR